MFAIVFALLLSSTTGSRPVSGYPYPALDMNQSKELYQLVANGQYDNAVSLIKAMDTSLAYGFISETVEKLLDSHSTGKAKVMSFAYKLWSSGAKDVFQRHFPVTFKNIFNQDYVKIVNKKFGQALKLDANRDNDGDRLAWGDSHDQTSNRVSWKFVPVWEENEVTFKIYNIDRTMFLKLAVATDSAGDRQAYGSNDSDTNRHKFYLEPHSENGDLVFFIINLKYNQGLKLIVAPDKYGDRMLMSHNGDIYENNDRFKWTISAW